MICTHPKCKHNTLTPVWTKATLILYVSSEGQGSLACYSPWRYKESDTTKWLNNNQHLYKKNLNRIDIVKNNEKWQIYSLKPPLGFPSGSAMRNLPAMQETLVRSLGEEDPLEEGMTTHSRNSCLENLMDRGTWQAVVHRAAKSWIWLKQHSTHASMPPLVSEEMIYSVL